MLVTLMSMPEDIDDNSMAVIERFVFLLYDRTSSVTGVNNARQEFFSKKSRNLDSILPSQAALVQHTRRAVLQAGFIWSQSHLKHQVVPCPSAWGCKEMGRRGNQSGRLFPRPKTAAMNVFIVAARKDAEDTCLRANLDCTGLCYCGGNCN